MAKANVRVKKKVKKNIAEGDRKSVVGKECVPLRVDVGGGRRVK